MVDTGNDYSTIELKYIPSMKYIPSHPLLYEDIAYNETF